MNRRFSKAASMVLSATMILSLATPAFASPAPAPESNVDSGTGEGSSNMTLTITCTHENTKYEYVDDSTHNIVCSDCGIFMNSGEHNIEYKDNGNGTHTGRCTLCNHAIVNQEAHIDTNHDSICDKCGAEVLCTHENLQYIDNGDGTHKIQCQDCTQVTVEKEGHVDYDKDCVCDKCYAEAHAVRYSDNGDGTHDGVCDNCDTIIVDNETHTDENPDDGFCDKCGYAMDGSGTLLVASVPVSIPIVANMSGNAVIQTEASIVNLVEDKAIRVSELRVDLNGDWPLVDGDTRFSKADKGTKALAMGFRQSPVKVDGTVELKEDEWNIGAGDTFPLHIWAFIPPQTEEATQVTIGDIHFKLGWASDSEAQTSPLNTYTITVGTCEHGTTDTDEVQTNESGIVTRLPEVTCNDSYKFSRWADSEGATVEIGTRLQSDTTINAVFASGTIIDTNRMNNLLQSQARIIRFDKGNPADGVDISRNSDRSVLATLNTSTHTGVIYLNDSYLKSMSNLFKNYQILTSVDLSDLDTSAVTTMYFTFAGCSALTSLDLSNFDTSVVTDMYGMFSGCSALTSLDLSNFDTSAVTNMNGMFSGCKVLTSLDLSNFDTSAVTSMENMFSGCNNLTSLDLSNFDTSAVPSMERMFSYCNNLTSLDLSSFDTSIVTNMYSMFYGCKALTSLDLSNFDTSVVTDMSEVFSGCNNLTSLDLSNFDTSMVTNMRGMFFGCKALTSLDISSFIISDNTIIYDGYGDSGIFENCQNLTTLYVKDDDTKTRVSGSRNFPSSCTIIVGAPDQSI